MTQEPQTEVNGVLSPRLNDLMNRSCSVEELQAALVHLILRYNEQGKAMQLALNEKEPRKWRATI